jgi:hypothetical protein
LDRGLGRPQSQSGHASDGKKFSHMFLSTSWLILGIQQLLNIRYVQQTSKNISISLKQEMKMQKKRISQRFKSMQLFQDFTFF